MEIFVSFVHFNASLLNNGINFFTKNVIDPKLLNGSVLPQLS